MVPYYGDFAEDDTVLIPFNTFSSDDPSASVTVTDLADADIKVHKDGGTTEIATDGATVAINYDGQTGNHLVTIDTSVHSDYATGSEYTVRLEGITVDAATLNVWIGAFSIERAGGALAVAKSIETKIDTIDGIVDNILTDTGTTLDGKIDTIDGNVDSILTDTGTTIPGTITTIDTNVDAILVDTGTTIPATLTTIDGIVDDILVDTAEIGAAGAGLSAVPWNASWDAEVESEVDDALGGGTGTALTAVPWNAAWDAEVQSEVNDALVALKLDHLVAVADADDVADDSIMGKLASTDGDWSNFSETTDSLQSIRDYTAKGIPKNVAKTNIPVLMVDSTDHVSPKTLLTLTEEVSKDAGGFAACTGTSAEIANGWYQFDASQADMNGDILIFKFTGTDADATHITFFTSTPSA